MLPRPPRNLRRCTLLYFTFACCFAVVYHIIQNINLIISISDYDNNLTTLLATIPNLNYNNNSLFKQQQQPLSTDDDVRRSTSRLMDNGNNNNTDDDKESNPSTTTTILNSPSKWDPQQKPTKTNKTTIIRNYPRIIKCDSTLFDNCVQVKQQQHFATTSPHDDKTHDALSHYDAHRKEFVSKSSQEINKAAVQEDCEDLHEWVKNKTFYVNCNSLHELDLESGTATGTAQYLSSGTARSAWRVEYSNGVASPIVGGKEEEVEKQQKKSTTAVALKTIKHATYSGKGDSSWQDGMILAEMTSSPHVVSVYALCGRSQILELAVGGSLDDLFMLERRSKKTHPDKVILPSVDRLKIMIQMTSAIADLHDHNIAHGDLDLEQFVRIDGVYKIQDFHCSHILKRDRNTGEICHQKPYHARYWWFLNAPEVNSGREISIEKMDVYMLGNTMYELLTNYWLFEFENKEGLHPKKQGNFRDLVIKQIQTGDRSTFPRHIKESNDTAIQVMLNATNMAWTHDVHMRPSARTISNYLLTESRKIEEKGKVDTGIIKKQGNDDNGINDINTIRVHKPEIPPKRNWTYGSDDDYWSNLGYR